MMTHNTTIIIDQFYNDQALYIDYVYHRVDKLEESNRGFCRSLIQHYGKYGRLSEKQAVYMIKFYNQLVMSDSNSGSAGQVSTISWDTSQLFELFNTGATHLKFPKLSIPIDADRKLSIYIRVYSNPGNLGIKLNGIIVADISHVTGDVIWKTDIPNKTKLDIKHALDKEDLAKSLMATGIKFSHCCFCGQEITTAESLYAGYGPICAEHWGLPWGETGEVGAGKLSDDVSEI